MVDIREATIEDREEVFDLLRQLMTSANMDSPINQPSAIETFRQVIEEEKGTVLVARGGRPDAGAADALLSGGNTLRWHLLLHRGVHRHRAGAG